MNIYTEIKGLGSTIGMLSMLNHYCKNCSLHCVSGSVDLVADLVDFFDLEIDVYNSLGSNSTAEFSDHGKFFIPYIQHSSKLGDRVGISWVADPEQIFHINSTNVYPYCKYHSANIKNQLIDRYNAIDLDSDSVSIGEKIKLLQQCRLVIAYDGGIAHLAHCLGIPVILLPWHHNAQGSTNTEWSWLYTETLHMDKQTWFLYDLDFDNIEQYVGKSNNRFLHATQTVYNNNIIRILHNQKWYSFKTQFTEFENTLFIQ